MTVKVEMTITVELVSHSLLTATRSFSPLPSFWMTELKNSPKFIKKLKKPCQKISKVEIYWVKFRFLEAPFSSFKLEEYSHRPVLEKKSNSPRFNGMHSAFKDLAVNRESFKKIILDKLSK